MQLPVFDFEIILQAASVRQVQIHGDAVDVLLCFDLLFGFGRLITLYLRRLMLRTEWRRLGKDSVEQHVDLLPQTSLGGAQLQLFA